MSCNDYYNTLIYMYSQCCDIVRPGGCEGLTCGGADVVHDSEQRVREIALRLRPIRIESVKRSRNRSWEARASIALYIYIYKVA